MPPSLTDFAFASPRHTKVLLVLDVVESVRLMEQDEDDFVQRWQQLVALVEQQLLPLHGGRLVKSLGDGLMLEFADAQSCVKTAFALQQFSVRVNENLSPEQQLHLRMGGHVAEYVADQHDIYGTGVNLTVRIGTLAGPGELVVSAELRDQLTTSLDADIEDLGECHLKHVEKTVRVYRVGPPGHAPVVRPGHTMQLDLRPTIAVIPFAMRSAEPDHAMLGEALADEVIAALSRTSELHVISRLSTTVFRDRHEAMEDIRSHLGASYILSGTCRSAGTQLALFVELIDTRTGHVAWADSLRGQVRGLFETDDELIARLVAAISSSVMSHQLQRARSQALPTLDGYTLLFGALALMHRNALSDFDRARQMLEHLIDRGRRHPLPHAWLAKWHVLRVQQGWTENPTREAQYALDCTKRALDSDPDCALALTVDGLVRTNLLKDMSGAVKRYQEALSVNPNESLAWLLKGTMHAFNDEGRLATECAEQALRLSPLDPLRYFYDSLAATAALSDGNFARALELAQRSLRANRLHTSTLRALAISQFQLGQYAESKQTVAEMMHLDPGFTVSAFMKNTPARGHRLSQLAKETFVRAGAPD